jgi:hypothetical protein
MNHYRRWGWYHTQHRVFMGLIKTLKTGGMLLWHMLDHFQQALSAAIVAHAFTQPNSKHISSLINSTCVSCAPVAPAVNVCGSMQLLQRLEGRVGEPVTVQLPALAQVGGSGQG